MFGPRGGKVDRRLNDPRFREGLDITVVVDGTTLKQLHLGYNRVGAAAKSKAVAGGAMADDTPAAKPNRKLARAAAKAEIVADVPKAKPEAADSADDDAEVPGKVKSFNGRILVVALANGSNRSFLPPSSVKVTVNGKPSDSGLKDPAIAEGHAITVLLETGGRRVREIHIKSEGAAPKKKAG